MPENWPVKSDYNSKWVIGALAEAKGVRGFDLKILKNGEDIHPHLVCPKDEKYHHTFEENSVHKCVFTC